MTPRTNRIIRGVFLAVIIVVGVAVAWTMKPRPAVEPAAAPEPSAALASPGAQASTAPFRSDDSVTTHFKVDKVVFKLVARKVVGKEGEDTHLEGVTLTFSYNTAGEQGTGTIVSDTCVYTEAQQKAIFQGHVHLTTEDGFDLRTESLVYKGDKGIGRGDLATTFSRQGLNGSSTGFIYDGQKEKIELLADVVLDLANEGRPPTHITSDRAVFASEKGNPRFLHDTEEEGAAESGDVLRFLGSVHVAEATDDLKSERLVIFLSGTGKERSMYRATATDDVDLVTSGGQMLTAGPAASNGAKRHLTARKLDLWYRPDHTLDRAAAGPDAVLMLLPGPKEVAERRRLQAKILGFVFNEQGKLEELRGQRDAVFEAVPIPPAKGSPRKLNCDSFVATIDPATGEASKIQFSGGVHFVQDTQEARAERARYEGAAGMLFLRDDPQLLDPTKGSDLKAETIDVGTRTGDITANKGVRHELQSQKSSTGGGLLASKDTPSLVTSGHFHYDAKTHVGHYSDQAVLRSGADEVRAPDIQIQEAADGKRRLVATGGVATRMSPALEPGKPPRAPVEAQAKEMVYEEARGQIVYKGDVKIRQGDIATQSPQATLVIGPDNALKSMVAGEPVDVQQGVRRASGRKGTYYPETEIMTLEGDNVVLKDPARDIHGRSLTFHVGDERVLVDGADETRSETIFHKAPTPR